MTLTCGLSRSRRRPILARLSVSSNLGRGSTAHVAGPSPRSTCGDSSPRLAAAPTSTAWSLSTDTKLRIRHGTDTKFEKPTPSLSSYTAAKDLAEDRRDRGVVGFIGCWVTPDNRPSPGEDGEAARHDQRGSGAALGVGGRVGDEPAVAVVHRDGVLPGAAEGDRPVVGGPGVGRQ